MSQIQIANAPCSWGVLEFDLDGEAAGYDKVLDEMCQSGYTGTEFGDWGFLPTDPDKLRWEMDSRELTMVGAFVPVALANLCTHEEGAALALKTAKLLATVNKSAFIVLADDNGTVDERTKNAGRIRPEQGLNDEQWRVFAKGADSIARKVIDETGLRTVFHHHCAGYVETPDEVARLLDLTDPGLVGLCLDTGHYAYGGGNPVEALKKLEDRIWHVHFKDCHPDVAAKMRSDKSDYFDAVKNGVFCELGQGIVDFPAVMDVLNQRDYTGWIVVEQDVLPGMGTPLESAQRNRNFLQSIGL